METEELTEPERIWVYTRQSLHKVFTPSEHAMRSMRKAFVLINSDLGAEPQLESELKKIGGVIGVYQVYGIYDMIVEIEAESELKVKEIIFSRIRKLEKVRSTLTLTVV